MTFFFKNGVLSAQWMNARRFSVAIALVTGIGMDGWQSNGHEPPVLAQEVERPESIQILRPNAEPEPVLVPVSPYMSSQDAMPQFGWDDRLWADDGEGDRLQLVAAIDHSLAYLSTPAASLAYDGYPVPEFTRDRVQRSLERFRHLLVTSSSAEALKRAVLEEFDVYRSIGRDGIGTVDFTGYFEPTYTASRVPTPDYRYPLYRLPPDFDTWIEPHPTRLDLEGQDGLQGAQGQLGGQELVWLGDRLEAFLIQVQGSARLQLTDGTEMSVGYAGRTNYPYQSIGRLLIDDGHVPEEGLSLPKVLEFFDQNPTTLDDYLPQNNRFVFFRETYGAPPQGTLSVPVTPERSIATDKSIMPPGALAVIVTDLPFLSTELAVAHTPGQEFDESRSPHFTHRPVSRYVLDQDTGGAIRGPGRVDVFMGTGHVAGDRAGLMNTPGELYYLLLRD